MLVLQAGLTAVALACDASSLIAQHEGSKACSYSDTTGHKTVGVGFNMDDSSGDQWSAICPDCPPYAAVYSGAQCLSPGNIDTLLAHSLQPAAAAAAADVSNYGSMCCGVQNVVTDMAFNIGSLSGFPTLVGYFEAGNWAAAASDMKGTLWCSQVGERCTQDAAMVAAGCDSSFAAQELTSSDTGGRLGAPATIGISAAACCAVAGALLVAARRKRVWCDMWQQPQQQQQQQGGEL